MNAQRVVVVGAGLLGLATSAELAKRGARVTVLEKAVPGAEASTAAAGILGPQLEHDDDGPTLDLGVHGARATIALCSELGDDVDLVKRGALKCTFDDASTRALEKRVAWQKARGLRVDFVDAHEARRMLPALNESVQRAAVFPDDHCLDPKKYGRALHALAVARGVDVKSGVPVTRIATSPNGRASSVVLDDGARIEGDAVIVCAGAWSSKVPDVARLAGLDDAEVFPVRGVVAELAASTSHESSLDRVAYVDGAYAVPRADGRVVCGSTTEHAGYDKSVTAASLHTLLGNIVRALPGLGARAVSSTWAGLRPATRDGLPLLGETKTPGLWLATGHYRNGVLLAAISAQIVADLMFDERTALDVAPFDPKRLR